MKEKDVKNAFSQAQKELEEEKMKEHEKQVAEVKKIVKKTLQEIEKLKENKASVEEKLKILKLDVEDLKLGKLERIKERQDKDPLAKEISVIIVNEVIREVPVQSPWYQPYTVTWNNNYTQDNMLFSTPTCYKTYSSDCALNFKETLSAITLNNSLVKENTIGTYNLLNTVVHLR